MVIEVNLRLDLRRLLWESQVAHHVCLLVYLCVSCSTERSKRGECCIYRSQPEMSLVRPERRCLVWPEQRCLVWPEKVMSRMAGDGDVLYGPR